MRILLDDLLHRHAYPITSENQTRSDSSAANHGSAAATVSDLFNVSVVDFLHELRHKRKRSSTLRSSMWMPVHFLAILP